MASAALNNQSNTQKNAPRTLIIEDDEVLAAALKRRLEKFNYDCYTRDNSNDALLLCHQISPQIILLDMHLKEENGLDLIPLLRAAQPDAKIILVTGFGSIATAVKAIKLGADDYLAKPVDTQTLLKVIQDGVAEIKTTNVSTIVSSQLDPINANDSNTLSAEQVEWEHINQVLKVNKGNVSAAARQLSMHRRTLQRKLQKRPTFNVNNK